MTVFYRRETDNGRTIEWSPDKRPELTDAEVESVRSDAKAAVDEAGVSVGDVVKKETAKQIQANFRDKRA